MTDLTNPEVAGYCPMGCGRTLFLADGGCVTCSFLQCPDRTAADTILDDPETEHIVELGPEEFTVRHPLRERLRDELMRCDLHRSITAWAGPQHQVGQYRVTRSRGDGYTAWNWAPRL